MNDAVPERIVKYLKYMTHGTARYRKGGYLYFVPLLFFILCCLIVLVNDFYYPLTVSITVKGPVSDRYQVYYDTGNGYSEPNSVKCKYNQPGNFSTLSFNLPARKLDSVRIDPGRHAGVIEVRELTVRSFTNKKYVFTARDLIGHVRSTEEIGNLRLENETMYVESSGTDPRFELAGSLISAIQSENTVNRRDLIGLSLIACLLMFPAIFFMRRLKKGSTTAERHDTRFFPASIDFMKRAYASSTFIWIIIGFGISLRLVQYLYNRPLWLDELYLVNNILAYDLADLIGPLKDNQFAPTGFVMLVKIATLIFGNSEYSLRLFSLVCGIVSVPLFYLLSKKILKPLAVPMSLMLFSITQSLIYYSSEAKQYTVDVLAVILIYLLFIYYSNRLSTLKAVVVLSVCGALVIWFSHPVVFVLAAVGMTLLVSSLAEEDAKSFGALAVIFTVYLLSFAATYYINLTFGVANKSLGWFWRESFAPLPTSIENIKWYLQSAHDAFTSDRNLSLTYPIVWIVVSLTGLVSLVSSDRRTAFFLAGPIVITLFVSALHLYPFSGRLILFTLPIMILLLINGLWEIVDALATKKSALVFGVFLVLLVFIHPFYKTSRAPFEPILFAHEEVRPVLKYISENRKNGDVIYCYHEAVGAYRYYSGSYHLEDAAYIRGVFKRSEPDCYIEDIRTNTVGYERVWVLYTHVMSGPKGNELEVIIDGLNKNGKEIDSFSSDGAGVLLYELRETR